MMIQRKKSCLQIDPKSAAKYSPSQLPFVLLIIWEKIAELKHFSDTQLIHANKQSLSVNLISFPAW